MDFEGTLSDLGEIDVTSLINAVGDLTHEDWLAQQIRQNEYEVHQQTESVVLLFTDGKDWPNLRVTREHGWAMLADEVMPIIDNVVASHYPAGGELIRAMIAKLPAGNLIRPHIDHHPSFRAGHRIHVPLKTNDRVRFIIEGQPHQLAVGRAYEINNQKQHSVMNKGKDDRLTLIFDYIPPELLSDASSGIQVSHIS